MPSIAPQPRQRREILFQQAFMDSIMDPRLPSAALRESIAEEILKRVGNLLTAQEKEATHIQSIVRSRSKTYFSNLHQQYYHNMNSLQLEELVQAAPPTKMYPQRDIQKVLYFWSVQQSRLTYGDIAYELSVSMAPQFTRYK
jgi:hypothetical protein